MDFLYQSTQAPSLLGAFVETGQAIWLPHVSSDATCIAKPPRISLFRVDCSSLKPLSHDCVLFFHRMCHYLEFPCFCVLFVWLLAMSLQCNGSFTAGETSSASFTVVLPAPRTVLKTQKVLNKYTSESRNKWSGPYVWFPHWLLRWHACICSSGSGGTPLPICLFLAILINYLEQAHPWNFL